MDWLAGLRDRIAGAKSGAASAPSVYYDRPDVQPDYSAAPDGYPQPAPSGSAMGGMLGGMTQESLSAPSSLERNQGTAVGTMGAQMLRRAQDAKAQAMRQMEESWAGLEDAARKLQSPDTSLLTPTAPRGLTDSEKYIPAGIAALFTALGARPQYVIPSLQNVYGSFTRSNAEDAQRQDAANLAKYRQQSGSAQTGYELAKLRYGSANQSYQGASQTEGDLMDRVLTGENALDLQRQKAQDAAVKFEREMAALPEKAAAKYRGVYEFNKSHGASDEQAMSLAMAEFYKDKSAGDLNVVKGQDIVATRDARIQALKSGAGLKDEQAAYWAKRTENYDDESAIRMAILGITFQRYEDGRPGVIRENSPEKSEYDSAKEEYGRIERDYNRWAAQEKEAKKTASDFMVGPEDKARAQEALKEAQDGIKAAKSKMADLDAKLKSLSKRIAQKSAPSGKRPASMEGYVPLDPMKADPSLKGKIGAFKPQTAADVLDLL